MLIERSCRAGFDTGPTSTTCLHMHQTHSTPFGLPRNMLNVHNSACHAPNGHARTSVVRLVTHALIPNGHTNDMRARAFICPRMEMSSLPDEPNMTESGHALHSSFTKPWCHLAKTTKLVVAFNVSPMLAQRVSGVDSSWDVDDAQNLQ